jgi:hypothetical protein
MKEKELTSKMKRKGKKRTKSKYKNKQTGIK